MLSHHMCPDSVFSLQWPSPESRQKWGNRRNDLHDIHANSTNHGQAPYPGSNYHYGGGEGNLGGISFGLNNGHWSNGGSGFYGGGRSGSFESDSGGASPVYDDEAAPSTNGFVTANAGPRVYGNGGGRGGKLDSPNSDDAGYGTSCGSRLSSGSKQQEREGDLTDVFVSPKLLLNGCMSFYLNSTCFSAASWPERSQRPRRQQGPHRSRVHLAATSAPGPRPLEHHPPVPGRRPAPGQRREWRRVQPQAGQERGQVEPSAGREGRRRAPAQEGQLWRRPGLQPSRQEPGRSPPATADGRVAQEEGLSL